MNSQPAQAAAASGSLVVRLQLPRACNGGLLRAERGLEAVASEAENGDEAGPREQHRTSMLTHQESDENEVTSDSNSSVRDLNSGGDSSAMEASRGASSPINDQRSRRKRKPTYLIQKEAKEVLLQEIAALEDRQAVLRQRVGLPSTQELSAVRRVEDTNQMIQGMVRAHDSVIGNVQSLLTAHTTSYRNPLAVTIRLGKDMEQRRQTLLALRNERLQSGRAYVENRFRYLDATQPYDTIEKFVDPDGGYVVNQIRMQQCPRGSSVKQVFDAIRLGMYYFEMSLSEKLGDLTVRDDVDTFESVNGEESRISNHRLVSTFANGVVQEMNCVHFYEYHPKTGESSRGDEYGIIAADSVDQDELYPYLDARVRKDISAVITVTSHCSPQSDQGNTGDVVIVTKQCVYITVHRPSFALPAETMQELQTKVARWGDMLVKTVQEILQSGH